MSYSKFLDDWSKVREEYLEKNPGKNISWDLTESITRDKWIAEKKYNEFIAYVLENYDSGNCIQFILPFSEHLVKNNEITLYKKLWKGVIRINLSELWKFLDNLRIEYPKIQLEKIIKISITDKIKKEFKEKPGQAYQNETNVVAYHRYYTLQALEHYENGLQQFSETKELDKVKAIRIGVLNLEKPKPKVSTDKRKINENIFWEIINDSRNSSEDKYEFLEILTDKLSAFKPTEIRKFARIFIGKFEELNTWENWALAYIVRRGCGDDEFDYFKAWVISKGFDTFNKIRKNRQIEFKDLIGLDDPQFEEMMYVAEDVFELKTGDLMTPVRVKKQKISGEKWTEENVCKIFPEICKQFEYEQ